MRKIVNPKQIQLFDPFDSVLTPKTRKRLLDGWPGVFRHIILELMPVDAISGHFDDVQCRQAQAREVAEEECYSNKKIRRRLLRFRRC